MEIDGGLELPRFDMDIVKMYEVAVENEHRIELYTKHPISQANIIDRNDKGGVEAADEVNVTASKKRVKTCARRTLTPKKAKEETHVTDKSQSDASPNLSALATIPEPNKQNFEDPMNRQPPPNVTSHPLETPSQPPEPNVQPLTQPVSEESVTPNILPTTSIPFDHGNLGDISSSTYTKPSSNSDNPQDELLTQYAIESSRRKQIRRSTKRPPPTRRTFYEDPNQLPSVFIPVNEGKYSDDELGVYCYESEDLHSIASDEDDQKRSFPQSNTDAPIKEVRLELEMEFKTLQQFKKVIRKFNIDLGRSIFFQELIQLDAKPFTMMKNACSKFTVPRDHIREKKESNYWRPFSSGDEAGNVYEVQRLLLKLTGLSCRHICATIAYQNCRAEEFAHNWLTMGAYNLAYQWNGQPVPSQEYWENKNHYPLLPPVYRKCIGRPTKKRDTHRDDPRENPDPHRAKKRYSPIKCKYYLNVVVVSIRVQQQQMKVWLLMILMRMLPWSRRYTEKRLWRLQMLKHQLQIHLMSSTAHVPPRPIMKPTISKRPIREKNVKRPPPSQFTTFSPRPAPPNHLILGLHHQLTNLLQELPGKQCMFKAYTIHGNSIIHNSNSRQMANTRILSTNRSIFKWEQ
ncbi:hypothetical protein Ahy_A09g046762 [Arachis hypogaea]|uniref:Uncharacterized protein n=1 Tax=Arachis hypogaea TaxID=3818 RepID=A0A445BQZ0_ARAHY|nr:hypothetical protein Ahy_A09g046762 [Arachis hypogaea]